MDQIIILYTLNLHMTIISQYSWEKKNTLEKKQDLFTNAMGITISKSICVTYH